MAKCELVVDDPRLQIIGNASQKALQEGLNELRGKVIRDHKLSMWFPHPMLQFTQYHNKIWEWDFAPTGDTSSTRKGWRVIAYVPDPNAPEPIPATAFVCWDKQEAPKKHQAKFLAEALQRFLSRIVVRTAPDNFKRQVAPDGMHISFCIECWERYDSMDEGELEILEGTHECPAVSST